MQHETCWTLIRAAADGAELEREEFGRRYLPAVRAFVESRWRGTSMAGEIDDAVQEVFVACFKDGGALDRAQVVTTGFGAFLFGITRNVTLHMERTRARRLGRVRPGISDDPCTEDSGLSRIFDKEYALAIVRDAMATMANRARIQGESAQRRVELLRQRSEEGHALREIARTWDTAPKELHLEQAKAAREFRSALREVVGIAERCASTRIDQECQRLLRLLE